MLRNRLGVSAAQIVLRSSPYQALQLDVRSRNFAVEAEPKCYSNAESLRFALSWPSLILRETALELASWVSAARVK